MKKIIASILCFTMMLSGCATYKTQYVSFRPPEGYPNYQQINGVSIGAEAYAESGIAKEAFGFDIRGAGLLPVQLVLDNKSREAVEIVSGQTFLVDDNNRYWGIIPNRGAVERVDKYTESGAMTSGAGKGAIIGAIAGTILGAALGIVSGRNIGSIMGKTAAVGAAGGAIIGGAKEGTSPEKGYRISDDIRDKGLEGKTIPSQFLANGFLFFPGEATSAKEIRLQYRERESGVHHSVVLKLK